MHGRVCLRRVTTWVIVGLYGLVASGLPLPFGLPAGGEGSSAGRAAALLAAKDRSRPFPCMDKPCGCATAKQCFSNCCCHTPAERLAWAKAHQVDPATLAALERRVAAPAETTAAASSCCSTKKQASCCSAPSDPACSAEVKTAAGSVSLAVPEICSDFASLAATANEPQVDETAAPEGTDSPNIEPVSSHTVVLKAMMACGGIISQWLSVGGATPPPVVEAVVSVAPIVEAILPGDTVFFCVRAAPDAPPPRVA
jgi:hypothetical protein